MSITQIPAALVSDNAITLAKLAGGTDGNIISFDASGDPVAIATGSDGQVLTSTGAGSPPAFEAAAGGWEFVEKVTASTSATVDIGDNSNVVAGFDYILTCDNIDLSADGTTTFVLQFGTGAGPTYQTDTYQSSGYYMNDSTVDATRLTSQTGINFSTTNINFGGAGSGETLTIMCHIFSPASNRKTRARTYCFGDGSSNEMLHAETFGERDAAEVVTSFRIKPSSGTIVSGDFILCRRKIA